jgi:DNA-directed RNA polymerase subunit RPC12/RpoP
VIKFKCIYCGQRIQTKDDSRGKKGKCPKCRHLLVVPESTKGRPAISPNKEPVPDRSEPYVPAWAKEPPSPIYEDSDESVELFRERFGFLVPTYDSLSVFLMAIMWMLFLVTNPKSQEQIRDLIRHFPTEHHGWNMLAAGLVFLAVIGLCFYMVLSHREKTDNEKVIMAFFAVITAIIIAYASGMYLKGKNISHDWQIIFPLWNLFNARMLLTMLTRGVINEECVTDRQATPLQIFLGLTAVIAIFYFCNYTFKLYWAITFSICIAYATSIDRALQSVFPGWTHREDEQTSEG